MLKIMKIWQIVKEQEQQKEENTFLMAIFYVNFWKNLQYLLWHLFENVRKKVRKKSRFGRTPNRTVRPKNGRTVRPKGTFVWTLHRVANQAWMVQIPLRDTFPCFDSTFFPYKSALFFACLLFCKTNVIFLTSIIHIIINAKSNWT